MNNKPKNWDECSYTDRQRITRFVVPIYEWMRDNKHSLKRGVTHSYYFCHVVPLNNNQEGTFENAREDNVQRARYANLLSGLKNRGFLRYQRELPQQPRVWSVNEAILPPGTVTYTGVKHIIPLTTAEPETSPVLQPDSETAQAFLENELKSIKVQECTLGNGELNYTAELHLHDVTLWDIYKIGLAIEQTITTKYTKEILAPGMIKETISTTEEDTNGQETEPEQQPDERISNEDIVVISETEEGAAF